MVLKFKKTPRIRDGACSVDQMDVRDKLLLNNLLHSVTVDAPLVA
jgi:hypothetical protein